MNGVRYAAPTFVYGEIPRRVYMPVKEYAAFGFARGGAYCRYVMAGFLCKEKVDGLSL